MLKTLHLRLNDKAEEEVTADRMFSNRYFWHSSAELWVSSHFVNWNVQAYGLVQDNHLNW